MVNLLLVYLSDPLHDGHTLISLSSRHQPSGWQNLFGIQNIYLCDEDYDDINDLSKCLDKIRTLASAICLMLLVWSSNCLSIVYQGNVEDGSLTFF